MFHTQELTCSHCKETFPADTNYFPRDTRKTNGLSSWCKGCMKESTELSKLRRMTNKAGTTPQQQLRDCFDGKSPHQSIPFTPEELEYEENLPLQRTALEQQLREDKLAYNVYMTNYQQLQRDLAEQQKKASQEYNDFLTKYTITKGDLAVKIIDIDNEIIKIKMERSFRANQDRLWEIEISRVTAERRVGLPTTKMVMINGKVLHLGQNK